MIHAVHMSAPQGNEKMLKSIFALDISPGVSICVRDAPRGNEKMLKSVFALDIFPGVSICVRDTSGGGFPVMAPNHVFFFIAGLLVESMHSWMLKYVRVVL